MRRTFVLSVSALALAFSGGGCGGTPEFAQSGAGGAGTSSDSSATGASNTTSGSGDATTSSGAGTGGGTGAGGASACSGLTLGPGDHEGTVDGGRAYRVHVPPSYSTSSPASVVVVLHGYTETNTDIEKISQMSPASDAHGFLAVYPVGLGKSWNAGTCCGTSASSKVDDVGFVGAVLDKLATEYCVDPKRVFAAGLSNGGMLSHRLACEMSDRIAAIGPVAGTFAISSCSPGRPVPVMHVHGTGDVIVPYNGGNLGGAKSVAETIDKWKAVNGCTDAAPTNVFKNGDASCDEYTQCAMGAAIRLCTIANGGHQWPGGMPGGFGNLSKDLNTSDEMAKFFEAHPMP